MTRVVQRYQHEDAIAVLEHVQAAGGLFELPEVAIVRP